MEAQAKTALQTALNLKPGERVLVITDRKSKEIGEAFARGARELGGEVLVMDLDEYRPLKDLRPEIEDKIREFRPDVSLYVASSVKGEVTMRIKLIKLLTQEIKARHAHMPGITREIMETGMRADYNRVYEVTMAVYERLRDADTLEILSRAGTELYVDLGYRWKPDTGRLWNPGEWGNLPAGEVFTAPKNADGVIVVDGVLGDYFSEKYGVLKETVEITVENGRAVEVQSHNPNLERELRDYLFNGPENADRLGEVALGTNVFLKRLVGNLLQDEKFPSVHVAFGDPIGEETGAEWTCDVHLDMVLLNTTVIKGERIMVKGVYPWLTGKS